MSALVIGSRVHYSGDMANAPGWFTVSDIRDNGSFDLVEREGGEGRTFFGVHRHHIGNEYHGHCSPRFVTGAAYDDYRPVLDDEPFPKAETREYPEFPAGEFPNWRGGA
jgi:hypothetical protein